MAIPGYRVKALVTENFPHLRKGQEIWLCWERGWWNWTMSEADANIFSDSEKALSAASRSNDHGRNDPSEPWHRFVDRTDVQVVQVEAIDT